MRTSLATLHTQPSRQRASCLRRNRHHPSSLFRTMRLKSPPTPWAKHHSRRRHVQSNMQLSNPRSAIESFVAKRTCIPPSSILHIQALLYPVPVEPSLHLHHVVLIQITLVRRCREATVLWIWPVLIQYTKAVRYNCRGISQVFWILKYIWGIFHHPLYR